MREKDGAILELKNRISHLDKDNLEMHCQIKNLESKLQYSKEEYETQITELEERNDEVKKENKHIRLASSKEIREDGSDLKKKVETLERQLERKEELLKKMTDMRKEADADRNTENASLKQEVGRLKDSLEKLERSPAGELSSTTSIDMRVQMEKMKKELEATKKSEKTLLIERNRLESGSHELQDELVKGKMRIANILNVIQETGDEKLISEAYSLIE